MKKVGIIFVVLIMCISVKSYALESKSKGKNIEKVFKMADEVLPGTYEKWEEARNYRVNLKDEIIKKRREQWVASAEDREALKETVDLEEDYLLNQYNEGILTAAEYESQLRALHNNYNKTMVDKNRAWIEEVKRDQDIIEEYKSVMKESIQELIEGVKTNNSVKVNKSVERFLSAYDKTTEVLKEKMSNIN